jgi:hypothetical protein
MSVLFNSGVEPSGSVDRNFAVGYWLVITDSLIIVGAG